MVKRLTESNIFEELDYAYHTTDTLYGIYKDQWLFDRYGQVNGLKMFNLLEAIKEYIK